jgi:hypothetical protein
VQQQGITLSSPSLLFCSVLIFHLRLVKNGQGEKSRGSQRLSQPEINSVCVLFVVMPTKRKKEKEKKGLPFLVPNFFKWCPQSVPK